MLVVGMSLIKKQTHCLHCKVWAIKGFTPNNLTQTNKVCVGSERQLVGSSTITPANGSVAKGDGMNVWVLVYLLIHVVVKAVMSASAIK